MSPNKRKSKRKKKSGFSRQVSRAMVKTMNKVDWCGVLKSITEHPNNLVYKERFQDLAPAWQNADQIKEMAVTRTLVQMESEGHGSDLAEIQRLVDAIEVNYDHQIHINGATSITAVLNQFFVQKDNAHPFVAPDGSDHPYLDELLAYRRQGLGVVYLVNHCSHLDEFLADCLFHHLGLSLPLFAAGDNMMAVPSIAKVFRIGSYVVLRRGAVRANMAALFNYCRALSECGGQQGIFLEAWSGGARSRDGSLRFPRRLVTLRGALACDSDVVVQPVSISYSIVPEDMSLAARKGPLCWVKGMGLAGAIGSALIHPKSFLWRRMKGVYGRAAITIPRPRLLSQLREEHQQGAGGLQLDEYVGLYAIREIARYKKVMASQLTARGLVRAKRTGADLTEATTKELKRIREYHLAHFGQEPLLEDFIKENPIEAVVKDGLATLAKRGVLAKLAKGEDGLPKVKEPAGLSFYATQGDRRIYSPTADQNIVVAGAGDWGFALTHLVGNRILEEKAYLNASLTLFDDNQETITELVNTRRIPERYGEARLPKNTFLTTDPASAFRKASEVILAVQPDKVESVAKRILKTSEQPLKVIVATTAFAPQTNQLTSTLVSDMARSMGRSDVAVYAFVGPVYDKDLVELRPTAGLLAGPVAHLSDLADLFNLPPVGVMTSQDPAGAQAAGILAGIYTMWGHFLTGSRRLTATPQMGHYSAAASAEAIKLGLSLGGRPESFQIDSVAWTATFAADGLAGPVRDFGRKLGAAGRKKKADVPESAKKLLAATEQKGYRVRPYYNLHPAFLAAKELGLSLPILAEAHETIWGKD